MHLIKSCYWFYFNFHLFNRGSKWWLPHQRPHSRIDVLDMSEKPYPSWDHRLKSNNGQLTQRPKVELCYHEPVYRCTIFWVFNNSSYILNKADPDQRALWSGSTLFGKPISVLQTGLHCWKSYGIIMFLRFIDLVNFREMSDTIKLKNIE